VGLDEYEDDGVGIGADVWVVDGGGLPDLGGGISILFFFRRRAGKFHFPFVLTSPLRASF
jgi:hypothetical protein